MLNEYEIKNVIVKPAEKALFDNKSERFIEVPKEYNEKYVLYNTDLNIIGYMGRCDFGTVVKDYLNIYQLMMNSQEVKDIAEYLDTYGIKAYNNKKTYILHVDILYSTGKFDDITSYAHNPHIFIISRRFNGNMVITTNDDHDNIVYIDNITEYIKSNLQKPII